MRARGAPVEGARRATMTAPSGRPVTPSVTVPLMAAVEGGCWASAAAITAATGPTIETRNPSKWRTTPYKTPISWHRCCNLRRGGIQFVQPETGNPQHVPGARRHRGRPVVLCDWNRGQQHHLQPGPGGGVPEADVSGPLPDRVPREQQYRSKPGWHAGVVARRL